MDTRPGQHIQHRFSQDIGGIQSLASISSIGVPRTLEEYKAWPAYPAEVSTRHRRNIRPAADFVKAPVTADAHAAPRARRARRGAKRCSRTRFHTIFLPLYGVGALHKSAFTDT